MRIRKTRRTVRLYVENGPTLEGIDAGRNHVDYKLAHAALIDEAGDRTALTGMVEVERRRVQWRQVMP